MATRHLLALAASLLAASALAAPATYFEMPATVSDGAVLQAGKPLRVSGWGEDGDTVTMSVAGASASDVVEEGEWSVELPAQQPGGPHAITVETASGHRITIEDVLFGEVWVASGQSNMKWRVDQSEEMAAVMAAAGNPMLRLFNVTETPASDRQRNVGGAWSPSTPESAAPFSAVAWHFGASLQRELGVPVGIIHSASGGTISICWTSEEMLSTNPDSAYYHDAYEKRLEGYPAEVLAAEKSLLQRAPTAIHKRAPSKLFNGMIAPLASTTVRGVIWYQGESDSWRAPAYERLFQDLVTDWRAQWREPAMPFLFVVLAGLEADPRQHYNYPYLREAQLAALSLPGVSAASALDVGEAMDIHPRRKQPVGERLALAALADVYGRDVLATSPMMASTRVEGARLLVEFDHAGEGLRADGPVGGFELAGEDGVYHPAEATIEGPTLVAVTSAPVPEPRTVRYCWGGFPVNNLQNSAGLPAMPFRTDDIPWSQP